MGSGVGSGDMLPDGAVICPGNDISDYCDCSDDCTANNGFCDCFMGQACCGMGSGWDSGHAMGSGMWECSTMCCDDSADCPEYCDFLVAECCQTPEPTEEPVVVPTSEPTEYGYRVEAHVTVHGITEEQAWDSDGPMADSLGIDRDRVTVEHVEELHDGHAHDRRREDSEDETEFEIEYEITASTESEANSIAATAEDEDFAETYADEVEDEFSLPAGTIEMEDVETSVQAYVAPTPAPKDDDGMSTGALVAIIIGCLAGGFLLAGFVFILFCKGEKNADEANMKSAVEMEKGGTKGEGDGLTGP